MPTLEGIRLKVERAHEHLQALDDKLRELSKRLNQEGVIRENDSQTGDYVWRLKVDPALTYPISIISGDFVHNLRSALDQLVFELATKDRPLTEFRIFLKPGPGRDGFHEAGIPKIWSLPIDAKVIIERMQPYNGWNGLKGKRHPLWLIHDLDRIDKHRTLLSVVWGTTSNQMSTSSRIRYMTLKGGNLKNGDVVAEASSINSPEAIERINVELSYHVSLQEEGIGPESILSQLATLYNFVRDELLPEFEPFFAK